MPLGAGRASIARVRSESFALIPAFTPANAGGSAVSTQDSNAINITAGDTLVVVYGGSQTTTRNANAPTGDWGSPPTFTLQFNDSHVESSLSSHIGLSIATATSSETGVNAIQTWAGGTMFSPVVGFFRIPGGASVRQVSSLGTKNAGSTTLTPVFSLAPLNDSLVVAITHGRIDTLFGSAPTGWDAIFNISPNTNCRVGLSNRLMAPTSQIFAGFDTTSVASGRMVEFVR